MQGRFRCSLVIVEVWMPWPLQQQSLNELSEELRFLNMNTNVFMRANASYEVPGFEFKFPFSEVTRHTLLSFWIFIFLLGTVGNILVIAIILKVKFLRTRLNMLILHLAVIDLLFIVFHCPVLIVTFVHGAYPVSHLSCTGILAVVRVLLMTEACSITIIAVSRYMNVCRKETYDKYFTKHGLACICIAIWAVSFLVNVNVVVNPDVVIFNPAWQVCIVDNAKTIGSKWIVFVVLATQYVLNFYLYWKIFKTIRKSQRTIDTFRNNTFKNLNSASNNGQILSSFVIFTFYIFLQLPAVIQTVFNPNTPALLQAVMQLLGGLNSSINCIIYGLLNKNVIRNYRQVLPAVWFAQERRETQESNIGAHLST